ncbi:MAG: hypothetical protein HYX79_05150 [Chloroflexi bacterium]|nr:hypothetical protein [Chloroflexota bacterium]
MKWFNLKHKMGMVLLVAVSGLAMLASACTPAEIQQLEGLLQNVDTANGKITITTKDGKTVTVNISTDSQVKASGANSSVFTLEPGTTVKIEEKDGVAKVVDERVAKVEGSITQAQGNQVTIKPESGAEVTINVTDQTRIKLESDQAGTLAELKAGAKVEAKYDPQTMNAIRISVNTREKAEIEGNITEVSGNNVTIQTKSGLRATVIVDNNTSIRLLQRNEAGELSDLKTGLRVHAKFNPASNAAFEIKVQQDGEDRSGRDGGQAEKDRAKEKEEREKGKLGASRETQAEGVITSVSGNNVTIQTGKGDVTFTVDPNATRIQVKGVAGTLADLKSGVRVNARIDSNEMATVVQVQVTGNAR